MSAIQIDISTVNGKEYYKFTANNTDYFYFLKKTGIEKFNSMENFMISYNASNPDEAFINATIISDLEMAV